MGELIQERGRGLWRQESVQNVFTFTYVCTYTRACTELYMLVSFGLKLTMGTFVLVYFAKRLVCACVSYIPTYNRQQIDSPSKLNSMHHTAIWCGAVRMNVGCGRVVALFVHLVPGVTGGCL